MAEWHVLEGVEGSWEVWEGDALVSSGHSQRMAAVITEAHNFRLSVDGLAADHARLEAAIRAALDDLGQGDTPGAIERLRAAIGNPS